MKTIHLMIGIPGCGKSTFSHKLAIDKKIEIVSTDRVRSENPGIKEELVWPMVYEMISNQLNQNNDVIFDATNITPKVRKRLVDNVLLHSQGFEMIAYYFIVDWQICVSRVSIRNNDPNELFLPVEVIKGYYDKIVEPTFEEGFVEINYINEIGKIYKTIKK